MTVEDIDSIKHSRIEINIFFFKTNQWISQQIHTMNMHAYLKSDLYFLENLVIKKPETQSSTFQWKYFKLFVQHIDGN